MARIALVGDVEGIPLLLNRLRTDPALDRPRVNLKSEIPNPEEMGAITGLIEVAIGADSILPALAGSLATWAVSRRKHFTLKVNDISVAVWGSKHQEELLFEILAALEQVSDPGD